MASATSSSNRSLVICKDSPTLARTAAEQFVGFARASVASEGRFTVALSGGSTPRAMFLLLSEEPLRSSVPWDKTFLFWSDERMVPPDHPDSNYRMANESLISKVPVPASNIHRMRGELEPSVAADEYEAELAAFFGSRRPRFDLILLGMGDDGHTASLFPGTEALAEENRDITFNYVPKFSLFRLTMTAPEINSAANVSFVVSGPSKSAILKKVLQGPYQPKQLPSQSIKPTNGKLRWMLDRDAASELDLSGNPAQTTSADVVEVEI
jgi:6-phosphogluconolactonase